MVLEATSKCDCAPDGENSGQKGLTYYAASSNPYLGSGQSWTASWTGTTPKCYSSKSACLVSFDVLINGTAASNDVTVDYALKGTKVGTVRHSRIQGHDVTQIMDIVPGSFAPYYNDTGYNELKFTNTSSVGVWINNLRIMRAYGMCALPCGPAGNCNDNTCPPGTGNCSSEKTYANNGNLGRNDCPCNYTNCGGLSFTAWGPDNTQGYRITPGASKTWTIHNPAYKSGQTPNYRGPAICFFNLNNVDISSPVSGSDVRFSFALNGHWIADMYHSRNKNANGNIGPGIDLVKWPQYFNDSPNATNTLTVTNQDSSTDILLMDGNDTGNTGRINIYRMYNVTKVC